jgi:hypothetical protein
MTAQQKPGIDEEIPTKQNVLYEVGTTENDVFTPEFLRLH